MRPKALILLVPRKGARQEVKKNLCATTARTPDQVPKSVAHDLVQRLRIVPEALLHAQVGIDLILGLEGPNRPIGHNKKYTDTNTPIETHANQEKTKTNKQNNTTQPTTKPKQHPNKCLEITKDIYSHVDSDVRSSFLPWPVQNRSNRPRRPPIQSERHLSFRLDSTLRMLSCL